MAKYNGHKNYNFWNVSLWLANDEGLYEMARSFIRRTRTLDDAARAIFVWLRESDLTETPDGAPYSISAIRAGIAGLS